MHAVLGMISRCEILNNGVIIKIIDNKSTRIISDEFYEYKTSIFERKYKWEAFVVYNTLGDYLVFNMIKKSNSYTDFINLKHISSDQNRQAMLSNKDSVAIVISYSGEEQ